MLCMKVTREVLCHDVGYLPVGTIIHVDGERQPLIDRWVALGYAVQVEGDSGTDGWWEGERALELELEKENRDD